MLVSWFVYIAVLLLLFAFTALYVDSMALVMLCVCLSVPFFMLAVLLTGSRKMSLALSMPQTSASRGENVICNIIIEKASSLPVYCKIVLYAENRLTGEKTQSVFKGLVYGKRKTVALALKAEHCGSVALTVKKLRAYDYFRLFHRRIRVNALKNISVFPVLWEIDGQLVTMPTVDEEGDIYSKTRSGNDPSEIFDIRELREDDDPRKIHWKLSAKSEGFYVKEYGRPMLNSIIILLDNSQTAPDLQDGLLDLLLSLSNFLLEQGAAHTLCLPDGEGGLSRCCVSSGEELYGAVNGILSRSFPKKGKESALDAFLNEGDLRHTHLIYLTADKAAAQAPRLREQPLPVTVMAAAEKKSKNIYGEDFRCIFVDFSNISNSLADLEL